jgi:hypothetical protein
MRKAAIENKAAGCRFLPRRWCVHTIGNQAAGGRKSDPICSLRAFPPVSFDPPLRFVEAFDFFCHHLPIRIALDRPAVT